MATPIYLKSSSVASKVPTTSTLALRELGVNTVDGILYLRQGTGVAGDIIIPINPWDVSTGGTTIYNTYFTVGNVGIGKTNPNFTLDVNGTAAFTQISANNTTGTSGQVLQSTGTGLTWANNAPNNQTLTFGTYLTGNSYNGSSPVTIGVAATSVNTANNIVVRDASGNFSAGTITANLTGTATTSTNVSGGTVSSGSGTTALPSHTFASSSGTGLYLPSTNVLGISTGGNEALRIDSSGNVGIGTTGVDKLTVLGKVQIQQDAGSNNRLIFRGTSGSSYRWSMDNFQSGNSFRVFREDDATSANGFVAFGIASNGLITGQVVGLGTGLYPNLQYYRLNAGLTGANSTAVQYPFGVSVTLAGSTIYEFESYFILTKSSGTGSHTFSTGFTGSATVNNIITNTQYFISTTLLPPIAVNANSGNVAFGAGNAYGDKFTWTGALTATTITHAVLTKGTVSISAGGSFSPYYQLSGAPGAGYTSAPGSYYKIYPLGASGSNTSYGVWA